MQDFEALANFRTALDAKNHRTLRHSAPTSGYSHIHADGGDIEDARHEQARKLTLEEICGNIRSFSQGVAKKTTTYTFVELLDYPGSLLFYL